MSMIFRAVLIVGILYCPPVECGKNNSVIWNKYRQDFVNLYSIPPFADFREVLPENCNNCVEFPKTEKGNFNRRPVIAAYYEEPMMIMFYDNDTKVTGVYGEIWNLLAEHLNFTLVPVHNKQNNFGLPLPNGTVTGLLGSLDRKEVQVIFRAAMFTHDMEGTSFTTPFWKIGFQLYTRPEYKYDNKWIITMFSVQSWYCIVSLFFLLSVVGYVLQKGSAKNVEGKKKGECFTLGDHFFYTFAMMCEQGHLPNALHNRFKILSISKSIFAWLVFLIFSSKLVYRMTNRTVAPPFKDLGSLFGDTEYKLLVFEGSMIYEYFTIVLKSPNSPIKDDYENRISQCPSVHEMYRRLCYSKDMYAMLENEERVQATGRFTCPLIPVGPAYFSSWVGSYVTNDIPVRIINKSIIKLHEVGLIRGLRNRWFRLREEPARNNTFKTIDIDQVYLIFLILCCGTFISLVILLFEKIVFFYEKKRK